MAGRMWADLINSGPSGQEHNWKEKENTGDKVADEAARSDIAAKEKASKEAREKDDNGETKKVAEEKKVDKVRTDKLPYKDKTDEARSDKLTYEDKTDEVDVWELDRYVSIVLAWHCMPTLLHMKPANLIQVEKKRVSGTKQLLAIIEEYANLFSCSCSCLFESKRNLFLLIYNRQMLLELLADKQIRDYLSSCGYDVADRSLDNVLDKWKHRLADYFKYRADSISCQDPGYRQTPAAGAFPHEIGLLLGYPVKDVIAYIENSGRNYLLSGYWKVYHDMEKAVRIFKAYTEARKLALELLRSGGRLRDIYSEKLYSEKLNLVKPNGPLPHYIGERGLKQ